MATSVVKDTESALAEASSVSRIFFPFPATAAALYIAHLRHAVRMQKHIKWDVVDDERVVNGSPDSVYGVWKRARQAKEQNGDSGYRDTCVHRKQVRINQVV